MLAHCPRPDPAPAAACVPAEPQLAYFGASASQERSRSRPSRDGPERGLLVLRTATAATSPAPRRLAGPTGPSRRRLVRPGKSGGRTLTRQLFSAATPGAVRRRARAPDPASSCSCAPPTRAPPTFSTSGSRPASRCPSASPPLLFIAPAHGPRPASPTLGRPPARARARAPARACAELPVGAARFLLLGVGGQGGRSHLLAPRYRSQRAAASWCAPHAPPRWQPGRAAAAPPADRSHAPARAYGRRVGAWPEQVSRGLPRRPRCGRLRLRTHRVHRCTVSSIAGRRPAPVSWRRCRTCRRVSPSRFFVRYVTCSRRPETRAGRRRPASEKTAHGGPIEPAPQGPAALHGTSPDTPISSIAKKPASPLADILRLDPDLDRQRLSPAAAASSASRATAAGQRSALTAAALVLTLPRQRRARRLPRPKIRRRYTLILWASTGA